MSIKNKIIFITVGFIILSSLMFGYIFSLFDVANARLSEDYRRAQQELFEIQAEQRNFELGKRDLGTLEKEPLQPSSFFSHDTSLVGELKILEDTARVLGVTLNISVAGTAGSAPKAKTATEIKTIPFTLQVEGQFSSVLRFLEMLEHAKFVTNVSLITVTPSPKSLTNMNLTGSFYIKQ